MFAVDLRNGIERKTQQAKITVVGKKGTTGFTRAIKLEPEEAIFYQHRGWAYELSKTYLEALTDLSRAIDLAPEEARLYDGRGRVHAKLHEYGQAVADYTHAIELDANYNGAYFDRGYTYLWLKESKLACSDFAQYAILNPNSVRGAWMVVYANFSKQRPGLEIG